MPAWMYLFMACSFPPPECADGYRRNDVGECVVRPQTESDTGLAGLEGAYQGDITISVDADAGD